jgi:hypothetical protein
VQNYEKVFTFQYSLFANSLLRKTFSYIRQSFICKNTENGYKSLIFLGAISSYPLYLFLAKGARKSIPLLSGLGYFP